jgi:PAS domain S-box-containing protein
MRQSTRMFLRYGLAVLVTAFAFALTLSFHSLFTRNTFALFYVAVLLSAYYGGLGPAVVAMALSVLGNAYFLFGSLTLFALTPQDWPSVMLFVIVSLCIGLLTAARERLNQQLGGERERLRVTLASIGDAVMVTDDEGCITFMNAVALALTGWPEQAALGQPLDQVFRIINEQSRASGENPVTRVLREGNIVGLANHTVLITKDGREIPIDDSGAPIRNARGKTTGVVLIFRDITERRQAEQALKASEERFRALIENSSDGITLVDAEGAIRYASPSTERVLGYTPEEFVGRNIFELMHPDDQARLAKTFGELGAQPGATRSDRFRYRHQDGAWRWLEGTGANLLQVPSVNAIVTNYRDVTERVEAQEQIRRSRDQLDVILRGVTEGITVQAPGGELIYANDTAARIIGFASAAELIETPVADVLKRFEVKTEAGEPFPLDQLPGRLALEGKPSPRMVVRFRVVGTGEEHWSQIEATPVFDSQDEVQFAINIFHEITERKRAEQRLRAQYATTRILAEAATLDEATPRLIQALCESLGWETGSIWRVDVEAKVLRLVQNWYTPRLPLGEFETASRRSEFKPGIGLPGRVWESGQPAWIPDVTQDDNFPRAAAAALVGLHGAFAFPITLGEQVLGVVEFLSDEPRKPDVELLALVGTLGAQIGQFVERKRAEEALRDSEERIRTIAETASDGIVTVDSDSTILFVNHTLAEMFGHTSEELLGQKLTLLMPPDQRELHLNGLRRYIHSQQKRLDWRRAQFMGCRKDGTTFPLEISLGESMRNGQHLFTGILRDISERRATEERLRFQANVLQNVRDSVIVTDLRGNISYWNEGATRLFGYTEKEMLGDSVARLYPDQNEDELLSDLQVILQGRDFVGEWRGRRKNGDRFWVDIKTTALRSAAGKVIGFIGVARDVTEQRESARALRASEERFRSLSDSSPIGIFIADVEGGVTYANPMLQEITGLTVEQARGYGWADYIHAEDRDAAMKGWSAYTREGMPYAQEFRFVHPQRGPRWVNVRSSPMFGDRDQLIGHVGTVRDITERKQATEALQFLAEASSLLASSLEYETTLKSLAHLAVPRLADWCVIDMLGDDGRLHELEIAHKDPDKVRWGWKLRTRFPLNMDATTGAPNVVRTGQAELIPEITEEMIQAANLKPEDLALVREIGFSSIMTVPLTTRGRTLGVIELVNTESGRRLAQSDLTLVEELARRAAMAVDNARLYRGEQEARRVAESSADRTLRLQTVTAALSEALTPEQVATVVVDQGLAMLGAVAGYMALLADGGKRLHVVRSVGYPTEVHEGYAGMPLEGTAPAADAVQRKQPIWLESAEERERLYPHLDAAHFSSAFPAYAAIPLVVEGRVLGAMGLSFASAQPFGAEDRNFILTLTHQSAQALERARLFEAEQAAHVEAERTKEYLAFLADASRRFAGTLDEDLILQTLAQLAVPRLADWCTVDVLEENGSMRMAAWSHFDPTEVNLIKELNDQFPLAPDAPYGYPYVIRRGESTFVPNPSSGDLAAITYADEHRDLIRRIGFTSHLCVPLSARGRTFGAVTLNMAQPGRCFTLEDLALAEEFARRAALALDNARLYGEAQEAIGLRDQFLSIASHELKTPLTSLLGYAELLQRSVARGAALQERDRRAVQVIAASSNRLTKLINTMLDVSRIETGQLTIERAPVDLNALTRRVVEETRLMVERHELRFLAPREALIVEGDELRLEEVLQNLIQNALKYSPHGGPVRVQVERRGDMACVAVHDQGIGIPDTELPNLFSRFYRVQSGITRHISGMGVGLYVVKEIVNLHGGAITVESNEGEGSTFTVCLPLAGYHG